MAPMLAESFRLPSSKSVGFERFSLTARVIAVIAGSPSLFKAVRSKFNMPMKSTIDATAKSLVLLLGIETARRLRVSVSTMTNVVAKISAAGGAG